MYMSGPCYEINKVEVNSLTFGKGVRGDALRWLKAKSTCYVWYFLCGEFVGLVSAHLPHSEELPHLLPP